MTSIEKIAPKHLRIILYGSNDLIDFKYRSIGQPVVVENVVGEGGNTASAEVARAAPDGRTLMIANPANVAINPALYPQPGFDVAKDFAPVARLVITPLLALIPASLSPQNMEEFITRLRTQKNLKYASGGTGNINHLAVELFKLRTHTRLIHVPAKTSALALTELLEGRVQFMTDGGHVAGEHVRGGRLRALAVFAPARLAALPDVPTAAEAGITDLAVSSWLGIVAPARTPAATVAKLQAAVSRTLADRAIADRLTAQGTLPAFATSEDFASFLRDEHRRWADVGRTSGVKPE